METTNMEKKNKKVYFWAGLVCASFTAFWDAHRKKNRRGNKLEQPKKCQPVLLILRNVLPSWPVEVPRWTILMKKAGTVSIDQKMCRSGSAHALIRASVSNQSYVFRRKCRQKPALGSHSTHPQKRILPYSTQQLAWTWPMNELLSDKKQMFSRSTLFSLHVFVNVCFVKQKKKTQTSVNTQTSPFQHSLFCMKLGFQISSTSPIHSPSQPKQPD